MISEHGEKQPLSISIKENFPKTRSPRARLSLLPFCSGVLAAMIGFYALAPSLVCAQTRLRLAYAFRPSSHHGAGAMVFAKELARLTRGELAIDVFPNAVLGSEREAIEKLQSGVLDLAIASTGSVGHLVPETLIFDIPFLFKDRFHAHAVLDSSIGKSILAQFSAHKLEGLAWSGNGFVHLANARKAIVDPKDLTGLKMLVFENEIHKQAFRALGASPVPVPLKRVFAALKHGSVDGLENSIPVLLSEHLFQLQPYLSLTGHSYSAALFLMSKDVFDSVSLKNKKALAIASRAGAVAQRDRVAEIEAKGIEELKKRGVRVTTTVDRTAFQIALEPTYASYVKKFGQERLNAIANFAPREP